ncbi:MAG: HAMP domain-containing histidine kinase [Micrococcales bacterium]|nr:HAMP domain-containing histidine kinase [Micrococcales bacterium]
MSTGAGTDQARPVVAVPSVSERRWRAVWALVLSPAVVGIVVGLVRPWNPQAEIIRVSGRIVTVVMGSGVMVSVLLGVLVWALQARRRARVRQAASTAQAVHTAVAQAHARWAVDARAVHQTFLSRLDHELKNPVTAIRASVDAIREAGADGSPVAVIDAQSARIASLVSDLRKLADLETAPIEVAPVAMEQLVADVVAMIEDELAANPAWGPRSIRTELPTVPWRVADVAGDVDLLFLAVYNVVHNAVKYSTVGASVVLRGMEDSGGVLLEVADTGQGIPVDEVAAVWDELKRASNARGLPGTGLGLSLVRTIVERHGGRVQLSSRLGEGTSVRLWLPFSPPGAVAGWNTGQIPLREPWANR